MMLSKGRVDFDPGWVPNNPKDPNRKDDLSMFELRNIIGFIKIMPEQYSRY